MAHVDRHLGRALGVLLVTAACAFGFRGLAEFDGEHALGGIDALRIKLPDTPIVVVATPDEETLAYEGEWRSVGGTSKDAEDNALEPEIVFERSGRFAELRAFVPLDVHDLVDLQMREIRMPSDRDLEIKTGVGDVDVNGVLGAVTVDVEFGEIDLLVGPGPVAVHTGSPAVDPLSK